jgi:hypothetical protein
MLTDSQVAGYVAKYATKGAEASGTIDKALWCRTCKSTGTIRDHDRRVVCHRCDGAGVRDDIQTLPISGHARTMVATCWQLGGLAELECPRLRPWAHMLGFPGHFSSKSRTYSTTLTALRHARRNWRTGLSLVAHGLDPATPVYRCRAQDLHRVDGDFDESVLVVGHWLYAGRGHSPGQAIYARTIAEDLAEQRRIRRRIRATT